VLHYFHKHRPLGFAACDTTFYSNGPENLYYGRKSMQQNDVFSTLEWTAIDMDNEFTVGFDIGFDFRTGWEKCGLFDLSYFCPFKCDFFNFYSASASAVHRVRNEGNG
jgi:hypothetical protein